MNVTENAIQQDVQKSCPCTLSFEIKNVNNFSHANSETVLVKNMKWSLTISVEKSEKTNNVKYLSAFLHCNPENASNLWSCTVKLSFFVLQHDGITWLNSSHQVVGEPVEYSSKQNKWGRSNLMRWDIFTRPTNRYVMLNKALIQANFTILATDGVIKKRKTDFGVYRPNLTDAEFVIGEKTVHVSKLYLAQNSPVFYNMFFAEDVKPLDKFYVDKNVEYESFVDFLSMIYHPTEDVNVRNYDSLLNLANIYDVCDIMKKCEQFLIHTEAVNVIRKMKIAESYKLSDLQDHCLKTFETPFSIRRLTESPQFKELSPISICALFERLVSLI